MNETTVQPKKETLGKWPVVLIITMLLIVLGLTGILLLNNQKSGTSSTIYDTTQTVNMVVSMKPANTLSLNTTTKVDLIVNPKGNTFTAGQMFMKYDPTMVKVEEVQNGTLFDNVLLADAKNGVIEYSGAIFGNFTQLQRIDWNRDYTLFSFVVTPLKTGDSMIELVSDSTNTTALIGSNLAKNLKFDMNNLTVSVK